MGDFEDILANMQLIHEQKNADYSEGGEFKNFEESKRVGVEPWRGAFIRLMDKYARCCNLMQYNQPQVLDETLEDTLRDLANYAVITLTLLKRDSEK